MPATASTAAAVDRRMARSMPLVSSAGGQSPASGWPPALGPPIYANMEPSPARRAFSQRITGSAAMRSMCSYHPVLYSVLRLRLRDVGRLGAAGEVAARR